MQRAKMFLQTNATVLGEAPRKKDTRHLMLSGQDITTPLCGALEDNVVAKRRILGVTCVVCLQRLLEIVATDSYEDAVALYKQKAPRIKDVSDEDVNELDAENKPTAAAREKRDLRRRMQQRGIKRANKLHERVLGETEAVFYNALVTATILTPEGDVNTTLTSQIQERINELS